MVRESRRLILLEEDRQFLFVLVRVISWIVHLAEIIEDPRNHTNQHEQKLTRNWIVGFCAKALSAPTLERVHLSKKVVNHFRVRILFFQLTQLPFSLIE
jgi:hypothetical protein